MVRQLLELGANPNYEDHAGFPSLIVALTSEREDTCEIVELLLSFSANIQQRGMNGFTPLHCAAARDNPKAIELLLSHGADPSARTDVDDFTTPIEEAENSGCSEAIQTLRDLT
jgi:ankyrin repeat protein